MTLCQDICPSFADADLISKSSSMTMVKRDGRICMTNNAAERALCVFALGRKPWLFTGPDRGAFMARLITTETLNDTDPQAWLTDVLARIAEKLVKG